jgi:hypothetical protein
MENHGERIQTYASSRIGLDRRIKPWQPRQVIRPAGRAEIAKGSRDRRQDRVSSAHHIPEAADRQFLNVEANQPSTGDLGGDIMGRNERDPAPAITACLIVSFE